MSFISTQSNLWQECKILSRIELLLPDGQLWDYCGLLEILETPARFFANFKTWQGIECARNGTYAKQHCEPGMIIYRNSNNGTISHVKPAE